jgi:AcrR family transcriptional regulator
MTVTVMDHSKAVSVRLLYRYEMDVSRHVPLVEKFTRTNQKARTRAALLGAATDLLGEGRSPSMREAAERALVSIATAYRYFSSAEDLWWEATQAAAFQNTLVEALERTKAAGPEPQTRLEAAVRSSSVAMIDDQVPFRRATQIALERWLRQGEAVEHRPAPERAGQRDVLAREVLAPVAGRVPEHDVDRIANALGLVLGSEAMIAVTDALGHDVPAAKNALLDAGRWILAGALSELGLGRSEPAQSEPAANTARVDR